MFSSPVVRNPILSRIIQLSTQRFLREKLEKEKQKEKQKEKEKIKTDILL